MFVVIFEALLTNVYLLLSKSNEFELLGDREKVRQIRIGVKETRAKEATIFHGTCERFFPSENYLASSLLLTRK